MNCKLLFLIWGLLSCAVVQAQVLHATDPNAPHSAANVVSLFDSGACSGYLKSDGTCSTPGTGTNGAQTTIVANDAAGTSTGLLASYAESTFPQNTVKTTPTTNNNGTDAAPSIVGVCISGCGTSGTATIQTQGLVSWTCDGTVTVGHFVQPSSTTAGQCHDPGTGANQVNENPEGNSFVGKVITANTGAGTAAQVELLPYPGYANFIVTGTNTFPKLITEAGYGSPFLSASYWGIEPTSHALASGLPLHFYLFNSFYEDIEPSSAGTSTHDLLIDTIAHVPSTGALPMVRLNASLYGVPNVQSGSGNFSVGGAGHLNISASSGVFIWTLTGNATTYTPDATDNAGHIVTFEIQPPASGGPYTFTWPSGFVNPPTVSLSSSSNAVVAQFAYDGTNYNYIGSSSSGGGGGTTNTIASGTVALGTSAIASGACATAISATATGTATTDVLTASFNGDPTAVTGYIPSTNGMLTIITYPTANAANFRVCNNTAASITPGAITLNWRVVR